MKKTLYLLSLFAIANSLQASVPLKWTVETSRVQPAQFDAYHGETLDLEATFLSYGSPLELPSDADCRIFWQTNGMGNAYWSTNAVLVSSNAIAAVFRPTFDPGATTVLGFLGIPASNYRAAFTIRFRGSPGATPFNPPPMPQAEYYTKPEVDSLIGSATNAIRRVDGAVRPLPPYLHALDFDDAYPEDAAWYYALPQDYGQCSSVRDGNSFARNYDWKFDRAAEFVVRMSAGPGRFASVGVANCGTNLTEEIATGGQWSRYFKCLPGRTVDGINENGVVANVNVVSGVPTWQTGDGLHPLAAVRWVLDNAVSAASAAQHLAEHIRFPAGWTQNFHWMVADADETWIVENGAAHKVTGRAAITNFPLYPSRGSGEGQERYDALMGGSNITSQRWTLTYTADGYRASDLPGIDSNLVFAAWASKPRESHRGETFGDVAWWQTVHTSVYDITNRTLRIAVQETDDWYVFSVPSASGIKEETDPTVADWAKKPNPAPGTDLSPAITYTTAVSNKLETSKQAVIGDLAAIRSGAAAGATAVQPGDDISFERQVFDPSTLSLDRYNYQIGADGIRAGRQFGSGILLLETAWFNSDSIGFSDNTSKIYFPSVHSGTFARLEDMPTDSTVAGWGYLKQEEDPTVAATNITFSNAVLAVGLNIDTNSVAQLNAVLNAIGGIPIEGTATTVSGLLLALAAAVAWLKKNKLGKTDSIQPSQVTGLETALSDKLDASATQDFTDQQKSTLSTNGGYRYKLTTATLTRDSAHVIPASGGGTQTIDCDYCTVEDFAATTINCATMVTNKLVVHLPTALDNRCRDLVLKVKVTSSTPPTFYVVGTGTETLSFASDNDDWATLESGENIILLTETERS